MAIPSHWVVPIFLLALPSSTAEEVSCPNDPAFSKSTGSGWLPAPVDYVALADDLDALNRSVGNTLLEIQRVPCSADWYYSDEPIILQGCCWALESALEKGNEVADCSNNEDFLPLDYFDFSHEFFSRNCGTEELNRKLDPTRVYLDALQKDTPEAQALVDQGLRAVFNVTLKDLFAMFLERNITFDQYFAEMRDFKVFNRPKHVVQYYLPQTLAGIGSLWCSVLKQQVAEQNFPVLSLFRHISDYDKSYERRQRYWGVGALSWIAPAGSFGHGPHLHTTSEVFTSLLTEGKKHWQFMSATPESFSELEPMPGMNVWQTTFYRAPVDVADEYPVYVGTQLKGEVMILPRNWIHHAYSIDDTVNVLFNPSNWAA
mmetsp:Transcript_1612/g.3524  ORF Transcript_1612/g.3524 Transcript_1612/m.3524 type:complete len:373 (+) Transcript_1612:93-1211(+)